MKILIYRKNGELWFKIPYASKFIHPYECSKVLKSLRESDKVKYQCIQNGHYDIQTKKLTLFLKNI